MHAYVCDTVRWTWWYWSLSLGLLLRSVLWHCWLGHLTRKSRPRNDLYNVSSGTLDPAESKLSAHASPQPKRHLNRFSVFAQTTAEFLYCLQWFACFPLKIAPSHVGVWTSCNAWFIGPTRVRNANGNSIVSAVFAGLTIATHWQSDIKSDRQATLLGAMRRSNA